MEKPETYDITPDLKPIWREWLSVARMLQSAARKQEGYVIAKCIIVLNSDGVPVHWLEPRMRKVEPKRKTNVREICDTLECYEDWV